MDYAEYQKLASRTESFKFMEDFGLGVDTSPYRYSHGLDGWISEWHELGLALKKTDLTNIMEELGDLCWYSALMFNVSGAKMKTVIILDPNEGFETLVGSVANHLKRVIFYRQQIDHTLMTMLAGKMQHVVVNIASAKGLLMSQILTSNIKKLKVRYPDKFTTWHAADENRDLGVERRTLEFGSELT